MDWRTFSMLRFEGTATWTSIMLTSGHALDSHDYSKIKCSGEEDRERTEKSTFGVGRRTFRLCLKHRFLCPSSAGIFQWSLSSYTDCRRPTNGYGQSHCAPFDSKRPHAATKLGPGKALKRHKMCPDRHKRALRRQYSSSTHDCSKRGSTDSR
jgi:hypothetical protein